MAGNSNEGWKCAFCRTVNEGSVSSCRKCGVSRSESEEESVRQIKKSMRQLTLAYYGPIVFNVTVVLAFFILLISFLVKITPDTSVSQFSSSEEITGIVYADIINISPEYYMSLDFNGQAVGNGEDMVCRCRTADGKTIWVRIQYDDYRKYIDPRAPHDPEDIKTTGLNELRIYGHQGKTSDVQGMYSALHCDYYFVFNARVHEQMRNSAS